MTKVIHKVILAVLTVAFATGGAWAVYEDQATCKKVQEKGCSKVVVVTGDEDNDGQVQVGRNVFCIKASDDDEGHGGVATWVIKTDDGEEGEVKLDLVACGGSGLITATPVIVTAGTDAGPDRGWLGVGLGEVPPALAAQFGIEGQGVMLTNVVKDSPAAKAGLERYDIVTAVNGEPLDGSVSALAEAVGEAGPSARVTLTVIHNGKEKTVRATLASRPHSEVVWKHNLDWLPSISEKFHTRGKVLKLKPGGGVTLHNLGDLKDLADLPDSIRDLIPDIDDIMTTIRVDEDAGDVTTRIKTRIQSDGQTIEIELEGDGPITVRRTTVDEVGDSHTTEKVYENAEELESADEEAFELYSNVQGRHLIELDLGHPGMFKFDIAVDDFKDAIGDFDVDVDVDVQHSVQEAMEAYKKAMESLESLEEIQDIPWAKIHRFGPRPGYFFGKSPKATHNFAVDSDGQIEIRIRKGDSEVVLNYKNENDLRKRNPEMYEKYVEVMEAPVED